MAIRFTIPGTTIEATADSIEELAGMEKVFPAHAKRAHAKRGSGDMSNPIARLRLADPRNSPQPQKRRYRLIPLWINVFKTIASTPEGITSHEVGRLLDGVRQAGLGRVTIPVRKVLKEHGFDDWTEVIDKERDGENVMWRPGPRIRDAILTLEAEEAQAP